MDKRINWEVCLMAYGRITKKQTEILEYIKSQILNKGYPPSVRDICEAVNLKSTSSVHAHLETLEKNGYIRRDPTKPRAIEIIAKNSATLPDMSIPLAYPSSYILRIFSLSFSSLEKPSVESGRMTITLPSFSRRLNFFRL